MNKRILSETRKSFVLGRLQPMITCYVFVGINRLSADDRYSDPLFQEMESRRGSAVG